MLAGQRPLCPAGHLPHVGGDRMSRVLSLISDVEEETPTQKLPISPLVGEMSGRTEGG
ncbi:MAG: lytic murein transglycosylase, partial [Mesorhizobium sp.]